MHDSSGTITDGAQDITTGHLMNCLKLWDGSDRKPTSTAAFPHSRISSTEVEAHDGSGWEQCMLKEQTIKAEETTGGHITAIRDIDGVLSTAKKPVGFLDLAGETRNQIYKLVLDEPRRILIGWGAGARGTNNSLLAKPIFQVSSQVRLESTTIFYSVNTFTFYSPYYLQHLIKLIGPVCADRLTSIELKGDWDKFSVISLDDVLQNCRNVKHLTISLHERRFLKLGECNPPWPSKLHWAMNVNEVVRQVLNKGLWNLRGLRSLNIIWDDRVAVLFPALKDYLLDIEDGLREVMLRREDIPNRAPRQSRIAHMWRGIRRIGVSEEGTLRTCWLFG